MASPPAGLSAKESNFEITRVWSCLWRIFPFLEKVFRINNINDHQNAFTLTLALHKPFGSFAFSLVPTTINDEYEIQIFEPHRLSLAFVKKYPTGTIIKIPAMYEPNGFHAILPPSRDIFDVHCTIARVLHASGAGHRLEKYLREIESVDTLAEDGSTAFTDYLTSKLATVRSF